jgi:hypothetical protein
MEDNSIHFIKHERKRKEGMDEGIDGARERRKVEGKKTGEKKGRISRYKY